ncbi:MAG: hypothetical protein IAC58_01810 [Firmicutes bacterium]|uniref:Uncharacterized protein n=1 Tax=Candidatus Onthovivens merdipullorum TaxID=2840889 RepID=A0A9D9GU26_9BACL|nr:hypothetical protein [Candidatus Onthovivens merdipullorum]
MNLIKLDFSKDFDFSLKDIPLKVYFNNEVIIFLEYEKYTGPITLQYLPNGGIQSLFHGYLIIKVNNGFLKVKKLIYKNITFSSINFIKEVGEINLINQILK